MMPLKPSRLVIAALAILCAALAVLAPRSDILTTITIKAPPARVWAVLTDTASYPRWNPMIAGLKGTLLAGATIENIEGYGAEQVIFWPRVLVARRDRELRWRGRLWGLPLLFTGEHYFLLQPTSAGTRFTQGEHFTGALLWVFDPRDLVPAFEAMNTALAARAEAR
ncbi:SRPBCC family protein [Lichenicoccus sp.]|uniref:SRPBCC family protein n=1 Tax=Lichenicoccus sp. TaxID=2781899 RepID=UPI003D100BF2